MSEDTPRNRLSDETSPYLLQHKDNPVHWWAWGPEALEEAKTTGKPILLSIGYAACHWCHVMAHESFEHEETAKVMNELFVNIKVDREERPDIDTIYMSALHQLAEQGGWPLTMFLTSDAKPFWGGTYFPREAKYGRPGFVDVLQQISHVHKSEIKKIIANTEIITRALKPKQQLGNGFSPSDPALADLALRLTSLIDAEDGGIRGAPKFPQVKFFEFLWRAGLRFNLGPCQKSIENTLIHICQGGIYDHLGGGFARYSVDDRWLAPHFEKMLYDNALLVDILTEAWRETQSPLFAQRIEETIDWLFREMIAEGGAFASSLDADSEGEEGKFYVWSKDEIFDALGEEEGQFFADIYDVHHEGNWEGKTILNRLDTLPILSDQEETRAKELREKLLTIRDKRIRPGWDDKVLADWNGLMIRALAKAGMIFDRADWIGAAERAFDFVKTNMVKDSRMFHSFRVGKLRGAAISNDYANMIGAAITLHQITNEKSYLETAERWTKTFIDHYWDKENGGFFFTADDTNDLIVRTKSASDDATPNANGTMLTHFTELYLLTGNQDYTHRADQIIKTFGADISQNPLAHTAMLDGMFDVLDPNHIAIIHPDSSDPAPMLKPLKTVSLPSAVVQTITENGSLPASSPLHGKTPIDDKPTAYICIGTTCSNPVTNPEEMSETIKTMRTAKPTIP